MSKTVKTAPVKATPATTTDSGRVKVGAGMIRFSATAPAKKTHDAGRVQIGAGMIRF